jgi:hypothetical protein
MVPGAGRSSRNGREMLAFAADVATERAAGRTCTSSSPAVGVPPPGVHADAVNNDSAIAAAQRARERASVPDRDQSEEQRLFEPTLQREMFII